jgi:uncharacterized protein (DUF1778 family)
MEYVGSTLIDGSAMASSTPEQLTDRRFQLRVTARGETLIKVAAERQGINVRQFMEALDRPAQESRD